MPVTAVRDEGALRMWVCRLPVHIAPAGWTVFSEIFVKFAAAQRADVGIGPYKIPSNPYFPAIYDHIADLPQ